MRAKLFMLVAIAIVAMGATFYQTGAVRASDHDDGETNIKARNRNLTDLYVFREQDQTGDAGDAGNIILIMNTNPRSVARQHYYFDTSARYTFHWNRAANSTGRPTGVEEFRLRFQFGAPNSSNQQAITATRVSVVDGTPVESGASSASAGLTTPARPGIGTPNPTPIENSFTLDGQTLQVFAGLREDPFFFDVEQYFRVRAAVRGLGPVPNPLFRTADNAIDFAKGYNVNAIVVRVPIAFLRQGGAQSVFDFYETISIAQ